MNVHSYSEPMKMGPTAVSETPSVNSPCTPCKNQKKHLCILSFFWHVSNCTNYEPVIASDELVTICKEAVVAYLKTFE